MVVENKIHFIKKMIYKQIETNFDIWTVRNEKLSHFFGRINFIYLYRDKTPTGKHSKPLLNPKPPFVLGGKWSKNESRFDSYF